MNCSTPGFPVLHYLLRFSQTHVHWVSDAIQPSRPLSPTSPFALNLSLHKSLFQWVSFSYQVAKLLELLHPSFQWIFRVGFLLGLTGLISLLSKGLSRVFSSTTIQKSINSLALSLLYGLTFLSVTGKAIALTIWTFVSKAISLFLNVLPRFMS